MWGLEFTELCEIAYLQNEVAFSQNKFCFVRVRIHRISSVTLFIRSVNTCDKKSSRSTHHLPILRVALHCVFFFWCFVNLYLSLKECSKSLSVWMPMHVRFFFFYIFVSLWKKKPAKPLSVSMTSRRSSLLRALTSDHARAHSFCM